MCSKNVHLFIFLNNSSQKLTHLLNVIIFGMLNPEKMWHEHLTDLSTSPVKCSHFTLGNPEKLFSTVLFIRNSDYLCYLWRKRTVIYLPAPAENFTTVTRDLQNFFIWRKLCCVLPNVGGSEKSQLWVVVGGTKKNWLWTCDVWQLECQASNVTASVQNDHLLL